MSAINIRRTFIAVLYACCFQTLDRYSGEKPVFSLPPAFYRRHDQCLRHLGSVQPNRFAGAVQRPRIKVLVRRVWHLRIHSNAPTGRNSAIVDAQSRVRMAHDRNRFIGPSASAMKIIVPIFAGIAARHAAT